MSIALHCGLRLLLYSQLRRWPMAALLATVALLPTAALLVMAAALAMAARLVWSRRVRCSSLVTPPALLTAALLVIAVWLALMRTDTAPAQCRRPCCELECSERQGSCR